MAFSERSVFPPQSAAPAPSPIVLRFPKSDNSRPATAEEKAQRDHAKAKDSSSKTTAVMRLMVGCLATNDPKKSSAGSFEVCLYGFGVHARCIPYISIAGPPWLSATMIKDLGNI